MNLGYVVHRFRADEGTGGYVVRLVQALARHHTITVYATEADLPMPEGTTLVRVPAMRRPASATILTFPRGFERNRGSHDLIHAQGWVTDRADVVTAHIVLESWRRAAAAAGVRPPFGERLLGRWVSRREATLFRTTPLVIAPSRRAADQVREVSGRTGPVRVIPHGFPSVVENPDRGAARRALDLPADVPLGLFAGDARKGLAVALAALAGIPEARLAVATFSDPARWRAVAERCGVAERVHWLGPLRDMTPAYAATDVLVHPTPYDTFGLVVAEAMALGRPAIVAAAAGITELFDASAGWILRGDLVEATTTAWREALDPAVRARKGDLALTIAARRPWSIVASETLAAYRATG